MTVTRAAFCGISIPSTLPSILTGRLGQFIGSERDHSSGESGSHYKHPREQGPVEHGFAHLKNWRVLTKLRTDPARATQLLRALLVLTNLEVNR
jgi:hypothetical protein